jgi:hypothetical protein
MDWNSLDDTNSMNTISMTYHYFAAESIIFSHDLSAILSPSFPATHH